MTRILKKLPKNYFERTDHQYAAIRNHDRLVKKIKKNDLSKDERLEVSQTQSLYVSSMFQLYESKKSLNV